MGVCEHIWRPETDIGCLFPQFSTLFIEVETLIESGAH